MKTFLFLGKYINISEKKRFKTLISVFIPQPNLMKVRAANAGNSA